MAGTARAASNPSHGPAPRRGPARLEYAGFWIRAGARVIDAIILLVGTVAFAIVLGLILGLIVNAGGIRVETARGIGNIVGFLVQCFVPAVYHAVFMTGSWQATPGKRLCGIHVVTKDGARLDMGLAIGRVFSEILSTVTLFVGYMMAGWTDEKRALHDMICDTRVVHGRV